MLNVDEDPNGQMNIWLSSSANHPWNPSQKSPATAWEAELDRLMTTQSAAPDERTRMRLFAQVQQLLQDQAPVIYLVHPHALVAYSSGLRDLQPAAVRPHLFWNIDRVSFAPSPGSAHAPASAAN